MRLLIGGYTADMDGRAAGIGMLTAGDGEDPQASGQLHFSDAVASGGSPSWLARHPTLDVVYAALEADGTVQAFRRTGESTFARFGEPAPAGDTVCHVAVSPDGAFLVAACYGDGRVVRIALEPDGTPAAARFVPAAPDPYAVAESPRPSRAHHAVFLSRDTLATTDLGLDLVRFWEVRGADLRERGRVTLPRATGPRHTVRHPSGHLFVVTEQSTELFVLREQDHAWSLVAGTPLSPATQPGDAAAEITLSADGRFVYVGVRGTDALAVLHVAGDGDRVAPVAFVEAGVTWPRHHAIVRDTLLVAGQRSDDVVSRTLDERTGVPGRVRHRVTAPSPTHLLPLPG